MFSEFSKPPWEFIKADLDGFVSLRIHEGWNLEFKSSRLLNNKTNAVNTLTKEVSAFNNADGGTILIGVEEAKDGNQTYAAGVEAGVPASEFTVTWLTQIIQSNIDATIPELRVHAIPITSSPAELVSFAIYVPRGKRAVQAKDFKYYQRYEDQSVPIRDFQVRDVNNRAEGPDINLALILPQDGQITRSSGGHRTGGASVHLVARNNSDILAENVVFRIVMPESLIQSDTHPPFHWKGEGIQPSIVLHYHGGARKDTAIIYHRLYRPP